MFSPDSDQGSGAGTQDQPTGLEDAGTKDQQGPISTAAGKQPDVNDDGALKAARKEAAEYRKRAAAAETRLKEIDDSSKSELELLQSRVAEMDTATQTAMQTIRDLRLQLAVVNTAAEVGVRDTETALALIDRDQLKWDDDGGVDVKSVQKALTELVARKPFLASGRSIDAGAGSGSMDPSGMSMNDMIRQAAGR